MSEKQKILNVLNQKFNNTLNSIEKQNKPQNLEEFHKTVIQAILTSLPDFDLALNQINLANLFEKQEQLEENREKLEHLFRKE